MLIYTSFVNHILKHKIPHW